MGAVLRADISWEATIDDTLTSHTGDIRNIREVSAVLSNRCIGSQRQHARTTWTRAKPCQLQTKNHRIAKRVLTAFEIVCRVDTLQCAGTAAEDTTCSPLRAHLGTGSTAEPTLLFGGALEGHDPVVTHWPLQTSEGAWQTQAVGLCRRGRSPVRALERARVPANKSGIAVVRVIAVRFEGRVGDLKLCKSVTWLSTLCFRSRTRSLKS
jgi:hypothetical protein